MSRESVSSWSAVLCVGVLVSALACGAEPEVLEAEEDARFYGECEGPSGASVVLDRVPLGPPMALRDVTLRHKLDVDAFEDGCLGGVTLEFGYGEVGALGSFDADCALELTFEAVSSERALVLERAEFSALSQCPNVPDELEGVYRHVAGEGDVARLLAPLKIADTNASTACEEVELKLSGSVTLTSGGKEPLEVDLSGVNIGGEFRSSGSSSRVCPAGS